MSAKLNKSTSVRFENRKMRFQLLENVYDRMYMYVCMYMYVYMYVLYVCMSVCIVCMYHQPVRALSLSVPGPTLSPKYACVFIMYVCMNLCMYVCVCM